MTQKKSDDQAKAAERADTLPPPASGDAYSAETAVREVPADVLDAIRRARKAGAMPTPYDVEQTDVGPAIHGASHLPRLSTSDDDVDDQARTRLRPGPRAPIGPAPRVEPPLRGESSTSEPAIEKASTQPKSRRRPRLVLLAVAATALGLLVAAIAYQHFAGPLSWGFVPAARSTLR
jgi:hypothetical protein